MSNTIYIESEVKPAGPGTVAYSIVLHNKTGHDGLVTHMRRIEDDSFHNGNYYKNSQFDAAVRDYRERCKRENLATGIDAE
jgi:hypothetical protein